MNNTDYTSSIQLALKSHLAFMVADDEEYKNLIDSVVKYDVSFISEMINIEMDKLWNKPPEESEAFYTAMYKACESVREYVKQMAVFIKGSEEGEVLH